ncbi:LuxR C-terminal-related transcriptional regulator [Streptomyces olivaceus]|uniref:LuxR C-terminal-related transcriptional regulator n=1 Tax=Streptomyces olivaceus TaxID=47716 RepID=UPI00378A2F4E
MRREADRLGAAPLRERLDDLAAAAGSRTRRGAGRGGVLTAREQDVLRLLALGHTNRRIGEELFISAKTRASTSPTSSPSCTRRAERRRSRSPTGGA